MSINEIIKKIRDELTQNSDAKIKESGKRFFKEDVKLYGIKTAVVGKIAKKYWQEIKEFPKEKIFEICEELYKSDYCEEAFIVSYWLPNISTKFEEKDLLVFARWIESYINNWAKCDGFCNHTVGDFLEKYPKYIKELKRWAKSNNRWVKRAAAVSLIVPAKRGKYLDDVFDISDLLLRDSDDMVQKGYGWLLKEASRQHQKEVFGYVTKNKNVMPRTALRYAIELMQPELRKEAMAKN